MVGLFLPLQTAHTCVQVEDGIGIIQTFINTKLIVACQETLDWLQSEGIHQRVTRYTSSPHLPIWALNVRGVQLVIGDSCLLRNLLGVHNRPETLHIRIVILTQPHVPSATLRIRQGEVVQLHALYDEVSEPVLLDLLTLILRQVEALQHRGIQRKALSCNPVQDHSVAVVRQLLHPCLVVPDGEDQILRCLRINAFQIDLALLHRHILSEPRRLREIEVSCSQRLEQCVRQILLRTAHLKCRLIVILCVALTDLPSDGILESIQCIGSFRVYHPVGDDIPVFVSLHLYVRVAVVLVAHYVQCVHERVLKQHLLVSHYQLSHKPVAFSSTQVCA